jgi:hypothetical protein
LLSISIKSKSDTIWLCIVTINFHHIQNIHLPRPDKIWSVLIFTEINSIGAPQHLSKKNIEINSQAEYNSSNTIYSLLNR